MTPRTPTILLALLVALAATPAAMAAAPETKEDDDKIVLQNEHVSIWFQGKKPMLKIHPAAIAAQLENAPAAGVGIDLDAKLATTSYEYKFTDVVEYRDIDGDGLPSNNEIVASLSLEKASAWTVETMQEDDSVVLTLTLTAPVKLGKELPIDPIAPDTTALANRSATVALVFTIHSAAKTIDADGVELLVPATSIKYDFVVTKWPFVNAGMNRLALDTLVGGKIEQAEATGVEGATVFANDTKVGALSWTTMALGNTTAGSEIDVPVRAAFAPAGDAMTRLVYTYDAADLATLVHDPTIGTNPTPEALEGSNSGGVDSVRDVPGAGILAAVGVVGLAALALRRRR